MRFCVDWTLLLDTLMTSWFLVWILKVISNILKSYSKGSERADLKLKESRCNLPKSSPTILVSFGFRQRHHPTSRKVGEHTEYAPHLGIQRK